MQKTVPISSIATSKGLVGGPFGSSLVGNDYELAGVPVIRGTNLGFGKYLGGSFVHVSEEKVARDLARNTAAPGDIVFTQRGTLGQVALVDDSDSSEYVVSQSQMRLRVNPEIASAGFVYYACSAPNFLKQISDNAIATGVPHINLGILGRLTIALPSLATQTGITEVLGALDEKIAANLRSIETMDRLQCAHFERLHAAGVGEIVAVERLVKRLTVVRKISKNEAFGVSGHPVFDQSENGHLGFLDGDQYIDASDEQPVLYFGDHTCKLRLATESFFVGPNTIPFVGSGTSALLLFSALRGLQTQQEYKRHWGDLMQKFAFLPSDTSSRQFESTFKARLPLTRGLARENRTLAETRDALLPQLMSGKLLVKDAEKSLAGVL